ncbi:ubiquitin [Colletotrichum nymphaeae SA-01]|uniref:Ubiquitin n=1 Tax=Colletotrichum nymphaeae SA-01 TaxID=1460502 RepID=A0A135UJQ1_9PEZI|nr:ubiquitin [Colletotrichum nymphaeae SA-01]
MSPTPLIMMVFGDRRRLTARPDTYRQLLDDARNAFGSQAVDVIVHCTPKSGEPEFEIDRSAYRVVKDGWVLRLEPKAAPIIKLEDEPQEAPKRKRACPNDIPRSSRRLMNVIVMTLTGKPIRLSISTAATVADLKSAVEAAEGIPLDQQRLIYRRQQMKPKKTLRSYSVIENDTIHLVLRLRGGKPAIYLMSPTQLNNVSVMVDLSQHWSFSNVYPLVKGAIGQNDVSWQVSAKPDGTLNDTATGVECSYLFWEADALTDPSSKITETHGFNPQNPLAYFAGNYVLSFDDFVPYLDQALTSLALTPAMRTEMIVYWLPKFQSIRDRGLQIAFNFIPQTDFEKAAKLTVTPSPSTVARVFLVFRGVVGGKDEDNRAKLENLDWPSMVGIDVDGMEDQSKFRVMEWGGMEVKM